MTFVLLLLIFLSNQVSKNMNIVNEIDMQGINTHRDNTVSDMDITGTDKKTDKETKS